MAEKLVSIILPTFSRFHEGYLMRCLDSVLRQSHQNFELIVVDDGSSDGSAQLLHTYAERDGRIQVIRMAKNIGRPALTTAFGYMRAKGEFITWVFDDCVLREDHVSTLLARLQENPDLGMVYGQSLFHYKRGTSVVGQKYNESAMKLAMNHIPNSVVMLPRSVVEDVGWYDPHLILKRYSDWDLWVRIYEKYPIAFIPRVLSEEFGNILPDSLGNAFSSSINLVLKYAKLDRNARLNPKVLVETKDHDQIPLNFLSAKEQGHLKKLIEEHNLRGSKKAVSAPQESFLNDVILFEIRKHMPLQLKASLKHTIKYFLE